MGSTTSGQLSGALLFRAALGEVLRSARMRRGMTLRQLSAAARVSLGYISEIERGQKEASSELLAALCEALDAPLSEVLRLVSDQVELAEITQRVGDEVRRVADGRAARGGDVVAAA